MHGHTHTCTHTRARASRHAELSSSAIDLTSDVENFLRKQNSSQQTNNSLSVERSYSDDVSQRDNWKSM